jgi:hypothetical protein
MIKRYKAVADSTISNAYKFGNTSRATGSNMGAADSLEVFALFNNESSTSEEYSRVLVKFDIASIVTDRMNEELPAIGSVKFKMKMYDVAHSDTLPSNVTFEIVPVTTMWDEGFGKDLENYTDASAGSRGTGASWIDAYSSSLGITEWTTAGGDYDYNSALSQTIVEGYENLSLDVTDLVEEWIASSRDNYGVGIMVTSSQAELSNKMESFYTKKFSARTSEYFFSRPIIQAEWDDSIKDDRGKFTLSSSHLSPTDNLNNIYMYNSYENYLVDTYPTSSFLRVYTEDGEIVPISEAYPYEVNTNNPSGIYTATFSCYSTESILHDVWSTDEAGTQPYFYGTIFTKKVTPSNTAIKESYLVNITNLKSEYSRTEVPRLRVFTRDRNRHFNSFTVFTGYPVVDIVKCNWKLVRVQDDLEVIPFMTSSVDSFATNMSYDISGSYFDFDMSLLAPGYSYKFQVSTFQNGRYYINKNEFKFRVTDEEEI